MLRTATRQRRREILRKAHAEIRRAYRDPDLTLVAVASQVGASPRQVQRIFHEAGGETFRAHLLRVRMERAKDLLSNRTKPLPVGIVARRVGYRQASGLRQAFVRYYGFRPSEIQPASTEYLGSVVFDRDE